ncbi:hypothetical protein ColKHC_14323 [Colletotrichum higginsianum]|nr:hypothetical protein ColKHC_14323 [Colletotrichum higginsianum]
MTSLTGSSPWRAGRDVAEQVAERHETDEPVAGREDGQLVEALVAHDLGGLGARLVRDRHDGLQRRPDGAPS